MSALYHTLLIGYHIIAQVVEAHFVIRAVGNICGVHILALIGIYVVDNKSDGESEIAVDLTHPLTVTLCKVIVYRDYMNALALQCIEVCRKGGNESFSFARLHFGYLALMKDNSADHLNGIVTHIKHAP